MRRKLWVIVLCVTLCCALICACATVPDTVATVNGTRISGEQFQRTLNGFLSNYGLTEDSLYESLGTDEAVEYKNNIIDEMVLQELMMQYASSNGLDELSDEDRDSITQRADEYLSNLRETFEQEVAADESFEGDAASEEAGRRFDEYVDTYDYSKENLEEQFTRQLILDRVYDDVMKDATVTEDEIREYYDSEVAAQEEQSAGEDVQDAVARYVGAQDDLVLYVPPAVPGAVRNVKHILLQIPDDVAEQIEQLEEAGDDAAAEEQRAAAMAELLQEAQSIADRARSGEDFDALIEQYNEDPGAAYYPDGYQVYEGASFDEAFLAAALGLANIGDISDPVESSYGYHIIMYSSTPTAGPVPYEEVHDDIETDLTSEKRTERWRDAVASWQEEADIEKHQFLSPEE